MMYNERSKLFHSSLEKLLLVKMSASWFLVSTHLIWILGSKLIRPNNQSRATLWVLDTLLKVGLLLSIAIFITASLSLKMYNLDCPGEDCALLGTWSTWDNSSTQGLFPLPETLGCSWFCLMVKLWISRSRFRKLWWMVSCLSGVIAIPH